MTSVYLTFEEFNDCSHGFQERIGLPDECTSALGHIFVGFSWLERSLEQHIHILAELSSETGSILTSEMSYKTKVSALSSLIQHKPALRIFNVGDENLAEVWRDILKMLYRCEELRNRIAHSNWSLSKNGKIIRKKTTAKAAHGLRVISEELDSSYLLDIYDYILNVDFILDQFFL